MTSTGTPLQESPELYRKGTTPSDLSPDASPDASPPPAPRNQLPHLARQVSVDEERGSHIQVLLEARPGDHARGSWAEKGSARGSGHKQPGNPKAQERRPESPTCFSWTSQPRAAAPGGSVRLAELDEKLSKYEMELRPLLRVDAALQEPHPQKWRHSKGEDHHAEDRAFGVPRQRAKGQNSSRPVAEPSVQRLGSLRLGGRTEPRLLRWDLTFSPPQSSSPVALESDGESSDQLKTSSVSVPGREGKSRWP